MLDETHFLPKAFPTGQDLAWELGRPGYSHGWMLDRLPEESHWATSPGRCVVGRGGLVQRVELHPGRLTWNLEMDLRKTIFLYNPVVLCGFRVPC